MLKNYFLIALRNLARNKLHAVINISGLAVGLASVILIVSFVSFEFSYDRFIRDHRRIYRVITHEQDKNEDSYRAAIYPNYHREVPAVMAEIESSTRLMNRSLFGVTDLIRAGKDLFPAQKVYYGDSTFFDVFSFRVIHVASVNPLAGRDLAVVTKSAALRYFGREDVTGEIIRLNDQEEFTISGVMEDIPHNCHFHFDVLLSMQSHYWESRSDWNGSIFATYFKLMPQTDPDYLKRKIDQFLVDHEKAGDLIRKGLRMEVFLQPLASIHLHSHYPDELEANNSLQYVMIFLTIAIFILLVGGINYINLETARSVERAKEVGLRKVFGAERNLLIRQFLGESTLTVMIAFMVSMGLLELVRPFFNQLVGINFGFGEFFSVANIPWIAAILIMLALLAGLYPAWILSGFRPDQVLKGKFSKSKGGSLLRKMLVIFQFCISTLLIIGTLVIYQQMAFMKNKNLGLDKDQILVVPMNTREVKKNHSIVKTEFLKHSHILSGSAVSQVPVNITFMEGISYNMGWSVEDPTLYTLEADPDIFRTLGLKFTHGRNFNHEYTENNTEYVLNEKGMKLLGEDILNRNIRVKHGGVTLGPVVGVVNDFNFASLHTEIAPLVVCQNPGNYQYLLFRINTNEVENTLTFMRTSWARIFPDIPFDFRFLSQAYDQLYHLEARAGNMMVAFTVIAILIAFFGLFGLSSFAALRRTKEVGIRKVLGSDVESLVFMFIRENLKLILVAFIVAVPIGYLIMNRWLEGFAYRISIGVEVALLSLTSVFFIATASILYQAVRAAMTNPVDSLRYE